MTITPRGVRSVSERILKDGRALIVTNENFNDYDFNALPDGSIHVDTRTGTISVKLEGETTWSPATLTVTNKEKIENPTLVIARDTQLNEEVFKIKEISLGNEKNNDYFSYLIVDQNKPEKEWEKRQSPVLNNGNEWIFELEKGTYLQGRNHLEVSVDGVLTRTVANDGIKEMSEKRFALLDTLEIGQTVIVRYVKWTRIGNPYPRFFLNSYEPEEALTGDFWLDYNAELNSSELFDPDATIQWNQIIGTPTTLDGYNIKDAAYIKHTHVAADIDSNSLLQYLKGQISSGDLSIDNVKHANDAKHADEADSADVATVALALRGTDNIDRKLGNTANSIPYLDSNGKLDKNTIIGKFLFYQETSPTSGAVQGAIWFNNKTGTLSVYNGSSWVAAGAVWK